MYPSKLENSSFFGNMRLEKYINAVMVANVSERMCRSCVCEVCFVPLHEEDGGRKKESFRARVSWLLRTMPREAMTMNEFYI